MLFWGYGSRLKCCSKTYHNAKKTRFVKDLGRNAGGDAGICGGWV